MVINRIQTLFLLAAVVMMVIFLFVPFGHDVITDLSHREMVAYEPVSAIDVVGLVVPSAVAVVLLLVAVFLFKKLPLQKLITLLAGIAVGVCIITVIYILVSGATDTTPGVAVHTTWGGGGIILLAVLAAVIAAYRAMTHDQKLLSSADRLR
ncbi:MAG: DUF4293 domain-containing protein [Paramuribaculum sp.]